MEIQAPSHFGNCHFAKLEPSPLARFIMILMALNCNTTNSKINGMQPHKNRMLRKNDKIRFIVVIFIIITLLIGFNFKLVRKPTNGRLESADILTAKRMEELQAEQMIRIKDLLVLGTYKSSIF